MAVFTGHISQMYMNLQQVQYIETHPSKILQQMAQEKLNNVYVYSPGISWSGKPCTYFLNGVHTCKK